LGYIEIKVPESPKDEAPLKYFAKRAHIYSPTEHTLAGAHVDMEVQFIHELEESEIKENNFDRPNLAIISIMYKMMEKPRKPEDRGDYLP
jgi:carbonic anhydrase